MFTNTLSALTDGAFASLQALKGTLHITWCDAGSLARVAPGLTSMAVHTVFLEGSGLDASVDGCETACRFLHLTDLEVTCPEAHTALRLLALCPVVRTLTFSNSYSVLTAETRLSIAHMCPSLCELRQAEFGSSRVSLAGLLQLLHALPSLRSMDCDLIVTDWPADSDEEGTEACVATLLPLLRRMVRLCVQVPQKMTEFTARLDAVAPWCHVALIPSYLDNA